MKTISGDTFIIPQHLRPLSTIAFSDAAEYDLSLIKRRRRFALKDTDAYDWVDPTVCTDCNGSGYAARIDVDDYLPCPACDGWGCREVTA